MQRRLEWSDIGYLCTISYFYAMVMQNFRLTLISAGKRPCFKPDRGVYIMVRELEPIIQIIAAQIAAKIFA